MSFSVELTNKAQKDYIRVQKAGLLPRLHDIFEHLETDPYQPPVEKLVGDLSGYYSKRINRQHRVVYIILQDAVKVISCYDHY